MLAIEVIYAGSGTLDRTTLAVAVGTTVREVIARSGILTRRPELAADRLAVGIFGRPCELDQPVGDGDRIEIYRPLLADPKQARRQRVRLQRRKLR